VKLEDTTGKEIKNMNQFIGENGGCIMKVNRQGGNIKKI